MPAAKPAKTTAKAAPKKAAPAAEEEAGYGPKPGSKAPAFKLQDDTGKTVSLSDYKGKKVVLYFYPKDSTPGCTTEACDFRDNLNRLTKSGAVVFGISADSVESHRKFKEKQGLNFPLLSDPDRKAIEAYGVWQEKSLYGRKFMGIVRSTFVLDGEGRVLKAFPRVKVAGHVDAVLEALK
jgi:peroxiredoxin Q/BCP